MFTRVMIKKIAASCFICQHQQHQHRQHHQQHQQHQQHQHRQLFYMSTPPTTPTTPTPPAVLYVNTNTPLKRFRIKSEKEIAELLEDSDNMFKPDILESEAASGGVLQEKVFLEISQNSQENTCARVFFLINLQV